LLLSGYLVTGLGDEKEQRVLEYLFSVVSPFQVLTGKLIGVVLSGLLQVVTWGVVFIFPAFFFVWSVKHAFVNWLFPFLFFFAGYTFYGGVLLSLASSASSNRESRQAAASWLFLNAIPLAFYPNLVSHPHSWLSQTLSMLPISSPITMMVRLGINQTTGLEMCLSLGILFISTYLFLKLSSARVLRNMLRRV